MSPVLTAHTKAAPACTAKHRRDRAPHLSKERSSSIMTDGCIMTFPSREVTPA
ncbi:hypothetical protein IDM40_08445 [Nocardiopsis sp. HNM0947]|uniref:Uncharacterized protein n=1 Tax=Nocardiopsis coralli TaxID=2772213 RepID=A0ABR9P4T1_9ACTN|nr:hypothetical protein [Nocardiopsis coralli]MBE2998730.1 hypothetical protein [Nocardiopsis coralli]